MIAKLAAGLVTTAAGFAPLALATAQPAQTMPQPIQRTTLQEQPFPGPIYHTVTVRIVVQPGTEVAPHTHPGVEMAYVVKGDAVVKISGRADQRTPAGGSFSVPNQVVHSVRNTGEGPLTIVSTYVVDKRKPIASPAPGAK